MARFHGIWSISALLGAMIGAACVSTRIDLNLQLAIVGAVARTVGEALTRHLMPE
jgi:hypothetical protein